MWRPINIQICCLSILAIALAAGCNSATGSLSEGHGHSHSHPPFAGEYPIQVVTTIGPITDMLHSLGGEHLEVTGLMGPGVDPHLYTAVLSDIESLQAADLIVYNGLHLEGRMADLFERLSAQKPTVAVTANLVAAEDSRLRRPPEFEGYYDPHVWHDPLLWAECAQYVTEKLCEFDPAHADDYRQNGAAYQAEMAAIDQFCRDALVTIPPEQRALVTAHDAFGYFCIRYELDSHPLGGISTEDQVAIGRMDEVISFLVDRRIKAVFVESAVAPRIVEALIEPCRSQGHEVAIGGELYADALGPVGSGADTYHGMIRANVRTITTALGGSLPESSGEAEPSAQRLSPGGPQVTYVH